MDTIKNNRPRVLILATFTTLLSSAILTGWFQAFKKMHRVKALSFSDPEKVRLRIELNLAKRSISRLQAQYEFLVRTSNLDSDSKSVLIEESEQSESKNRSIYSRFESSAAGVEDVTDRYSSYMQTFRDFFDQHRNLSRSM